MYAFFLFFWPDLLLKSSLGLRSSIIVYIEILFKELFQNSSLRFIRKLRYYNHFKISDFPGLFEKEVTIQPKNHLLFVVVLYSNSATVNRENMIRFLKSFMWSSKFGMFIWASTVWNPTHIAMDFSENLLFDNFKSIYPYWILLNFNTLELFRTYNLISFKM